MTWSERIATAAAWLLVALLAMGIVLLWPRSDAYSQRTEHLDRRVRMLESQVLAEREACRLDREMAERASEAWELLERTWRLEP